MPKLIIKRDNQVVKKLSIPENILAFTVGSEQGNDIIINEDRISFFHLQFEKQTDHYFVRDLQSQWGTYVNGKRITERTVIKNNDEIGLGQHRITFLLPDNQHSRTDATLQNGGSNVELYFDMRELRQKISGTPSLNQLNTWLHAPVGEEHHANGNEPKALAELTGKIERKAPMAPPGQNDSAGPSPFSAAGPQNHDNGLLGGSEHPRSTEKVQVETQLRTGHTDGVDKAPTVSEPLQAFESERVPEVPEPDYVSDGSAETDKNYYLLGIHGYYLGRKFRVRKSRTRIGRDQKLNDIVIRKNSKGELDQSVSRRHATISYKNNDYYVSDKRSKTRTRVNRHVVEPGQELLINTGDEIEILSDHRNHILRFVEEGDWNFDYPRKAGAWHLRYRKQLLHTFSAVIAILAFLVAGKAYLMTDYLGEENHALSGEESVWYDHQDAMASMVHAGGDPVNLPVIADVNRDRFIDLIYITPSGVLTCVDGKTKQILWQNHDFNALTQMPLTTVDLFEPGHPDILALSDDLRLRALDGNTGLEIWSSPILPGPLTGPPLVTDLNQDGLKDMVLVSAIGRVYLGYSTLQSSNWTKVDVNEPTRAIPSFVQTARGPIILLGTESGNLLFIDGKRKTVLRTIDAGEELNKASGRFDLNGPIRAPAAVADLTGDNVPDYVVTTEAGNVLSIDGKTQKRMWFDVVNETAKGNSLLDRPYTVLGDLDGDGLSDVVTRTPKGQIRAYKGTGRARDQRLLLWQTPPNQTKHFTGSPVLADINKNGYSDIVVGRDDGSLVLLEGSNGDVLLEHQADLPLRSIPLVADLNNDHSMDILVFRSDNRFHILTTNSKAMNATLHWGQLFHDAKHTNFARVVKQSTGIYYTYLLVSLLVAALALGANWIIQKRRSRLNYY